MPLSAQLFYSWRDGQETYSQVILHMHPSPALGFHYCQSWERCLAEIRKGSKTFEAAAKSSGYSSLTESQKSIHELCQNWILCVPSHDSCNSSSSAFALRPRADEWPTKGSWTQSQAAVSTSVKYQLKCSFSGLRWHQMWFVTNSTDSCLCPKTLWVMGPCRWFHSRLSSTARLGKKKWTQYGTVQQYL